MSQRFPVPSENIGHMRYLRILNLEDNLIGHLSGVEDLQALTELNVKRNEVCGYRMRENPNKIIIKVFTDESFRYKTQSV